MEEKNSVWGYILVAVVTIVIGVGIGLCISYFTKEDKEPNVVVDNDSNWEENNSQTNTEDKEENEIKDWTDYVLKQEITEMYIEVFNENLEVTRKVNITKEELTNIFTEMKKGILTKKSRGDFLVEKVIIHINYKTNGEVSSMEIEDGKNIWTGDKNVIQLIEKENYVTDPNFEINLDTYYEYDWNGTEYLNKLIENR